MAEELSINDRKEILTQQVARYVRQGWIVESETDTTANLSKKKKFSFWWAFIWFLLLFVGLIVYIFYYLAKDDETMYISIGQTGDITHTKG